MSCELTIYKQAKHSYPANVGQNSNQFINVVIVYVGSTPACICYNCKLQSIAQADFIYYFQNHDSTELWVLADLGAGSVLVQ